MNMVIHENTALFGEENGNQMDLVTPTESVILAKLSNDLEISSYTRLLLLFKVPVFIMSL